MLNRTNAHIHAIQEITIARKIIARLWAMVFSLLLLIIMLFAREGLLGKKEIWQTGRRSGGYGGK